MIKMDVPCGKCIGCRMDYARDWAIRCVHEAQMHKDNCFVTLTYDEKNIPEYGQLNREDFLNFIRRLRREKKKDVRYFHAGEYGQGGRPHYHAILFGCDFEDKVKIAEDKGNDLFASKQLAEIWELGMASVGEVTMGSAGYVARYCLKKAGSKNEKYVDEDGNKFEVDPSTGKIRVAEYITMSRRPGIGSKWIEKYLSDVYPSDQVVRDGKVYKPPRFYDNFLDKIDESMINFIKEERSKKIGNWIERSDYRLRVKERVKQDIVNKMLRRGL